MYVHERLEARVLSDICFQLPHIECLILEISRSYKFTIGISYRPPNSSVDNFLVSLSDTVSASLAARVPVYFVGDISIHILKHNEADH